MAIKFTQIVDLTNQRIINVASPTLDTDAVNKIYVDNVAQGLSWKLAARAASTGNVSLSAPGATIDGVTLVAGDRVLLMNQTTGNQNGVYTFNGDAVALTRTADADTSAEVSPGTALSVTEGTVNGDKTFVLVTNGPIVLDTTALTFSQMSGGTGPSYTAGNGVDLSGNVVNLVPVVGGGVLVGPGGISVDLSIVVKKFAMNVGDGSSSSVSVTHSLNTRDVSVELFTNAAPYDTVFCEVQRTDVNTVLLVFGAAPASGAYRVVVQA